MTPTPNPALVERVALLPCPFCGNPSPGVDSFEANSWCVVCNNPECEVIGPKRPSRDAAASAWNAVAALRAAGWRQATEPLPEDVEVEAKRLYELSFCDGEEYEYPFEALTDEVQDDWRRIARLVLADRQRAVEAAVKEERAKFSRRVMDERRQAVEAEREAIARMHDEHADGYSRTCQQADAAAHREWARRIRVRTRSAEKEGENA